MTVTKELLDRLQACDPQVRKFVEAFPEGVTPTEASMIKYHNTFDWWWAAEELLTNEGYELWDEQRKATSKLNDQIESAAYRLERASGEGDGYGEFYQKAVSVVNQILSMTLAATFGKLYKDHERTEFGFSDNENDCNCRPHRMERLSAAAS
jgi:hypothetical protein